MSVARALAERLLLFGLLLSRIAFIALGIAVLTAAIATSGFATSSAPSYPVGPAAASLARLVIRWIEALGAAFLAAGTLLFLARSWIRIPRAPGAVSETGSPAWLSLIAVSLLAQAVAATCFSTGLLELWKQVIPALEHAGVFQEVQKPGPYQGLVLLPVAVVLFVPLIEAAAALSLFVSPVLLLILFLSRSRLFPKGLVMTGIVQAALVGGSMLAALVFDLVDERLVALGASEPGPEMRAILAGMRQIQAVIGPTARAYAWLLPASLIWIPFMMGSRRLALAFPNGGFDMARAPHVVAAPAEVSPVS